MILDLLTNLDRPNLGKTRERRSQRIRLRDRLKLSKSLRSPETHLDLMRELQDPEEVSSRIQVILQEVETSSKEYPRRGILRDPRDPMRET